MMTEQLITSNRIDATTCTQFVTGDGLGGLVVFIGTVRNQTKGRKVKELEFECYEKMALKEMKKICEAAISQFGIQKMAIHHRTGVVPIGEEAVIIAVSAPHRKEAFLACEFGIDSLKQTVPIWKKEKFDDGEVWVSAHP
jgi:molybdopterin synthase catalytic subunit